MKVREARLDDAEALHALYHAAYSVHALDAPSGDPGASGPQRAAEDPHRPPIAALKDTLDDVRAYIRESVVLVAEDEQGELVATAALRRIANVRRLPARIAV